MLVRRITSEDIEPLIVLADMLNAHEGDPVGLMDADRLQRDVCGDVPYVRGFVAVEENGLCGFVLWLPGYETSTCQRGGFVNDLFVVEEKRQTGCGEALLAAAANDVRNDGGEFLWVTAYAKNTAACSFYQKHMQDDAVEGVAAFSASGGSFGELADRAK